MQFLRKQKNLIALGVSLVVIFILAIVTLAKGDDFTFAGSLWALLPPVVAIGLALITKEVYSSLFIGVVIGALMHAKFNFAQTVDNVVSDGVISAVEGTAGIFVFLVILGVLVALVNKTGASAAFGRWAKKNIKTRIGAYFATFILGVLIFIDDYFNCLTVGSVMAPVTDSHKISRVKLAYIIDATAAPVCMIAPISSWAAAVATSVPKDFPISGIKLFINAIPFNFYSLLTLAFIIIIGFMGFDYGKMAEFEFRAQKLGERAALNETTNVEDEPNPRGRVVDLIVPIVFLVVVSVIGLLYIGGYFGDTRYYSLEACLQAGEEYVNYTGDFVGAFGNTDATIGLPWGAIIVLLFTIAYLLCRRLVSFKDAMACIPKGFIAMVPAILILTLATALKNITGLLDASTFVQNMMDGFPSFLYALLPAFIFLVACVLAFSTGTSWGTFGILIPIVTPVLAATDSSLVFVGISACLAGAVCGDHCSPISDTTIMASAGANCNHVDHVSTQLPYALTVAGVSFVSFLIAGILPIAWICLPISLILLVGTLFVIRAITKKSNLKKAEEIDAMVDKTQAAEESKVAEEKSVKFNWILAIVLNIVTFGIYSIYMFNVMSNANNEVAKKYGVKTVMPYIFAWLIGLVTGGVFPIVWMFLFLNQQIKIASAQGNKTSPTQNLFLLFLVTMVPYYNYYVLCDNYNKNCEG